MSEPYDPIGGTPMEQNRQPDTEPRHVPTPEEIARAEAEAVRAMQRGEPLPSRAAEAPAAQSAETPAAQDWSNVPYVDDAPPTPPAASQEADDEDAPYEPSETEKRIAAIPEDKWNLYQTLGGGAVGLVAVALLTLGSEDLGTWALVLAVVLALAMPRYLERWWGRKMPRARVAMIISMLVALVAFFLITGFRNGFQFISK